MHAGSSADGERALRPIRELGPAALDAFGPVPYADLQSSLDDPPGFRNYWTVELLADLPDPVVDLLHTQALEMPGSAPQIFCVAWGGAVARDDHGPLAGRDARFAVHPLMLWEDPADDERVMAWGRRFRDAVSKHATGVSYLNFTGDEEPARVRAQYRPGAGDRARPDQSRLGPGERLPRGRERRPGEQALTRRPPLSSRARTRPGQHMSGLMVIGYDGSDGARYAIDAAATILRAAEAVVANVWMPAVVTTTTMPLAAPVTPQPPDEQDAALEQAALRVAAEGAQRASDAGLRARPELRSGGPPPTSAGCSLHSPTSTRRTSLSSVVVASRASRRSCSAACRTTPCVKPAGRCSSCRPRTIDAVIRRTNSRRHGHERASNAVAGGRRRRRRSGPGG